MKFNHFVILAVLFSLMIISGCKKEFYDETLEYNYEYQPLAVGQYTIFDVDSIRYLYTAPTQSVDTIRYQWMEKITDTFYDNLSRLNYRLELFRRTNSAQNWRLEKVWYCYKSKTNFERQEDDLRFLKLIFPLKNELSWKGNLYLATSDSNQFAPYYNWLYEVKNMGSSLTIGTNSFAETATIAQRDEENLIDKVRSVEVYAKNVGLISKELEIINKQDVASPWTNPNKANGFRLIMKVNSYGP